MGNSRETSDWQVIIKEGYRKTVLGKRCCHCIHNQITPRLQPSSADHLCDVHDNSRVKKGKVEKGRLADLPKGAERKTKLISGEHLLEEAGQL